MKIETKFNIGDEVWIYILEPIKAYIVAITIHDKYMVYHVETVDRGCSNFNTSLLEDTLFPTKEDLIKSL